MKDTKIVTKIEELDKKRSKIYLNQEFAFVLYKGEIVRYKLKENQELAEEILEIIEKDILPKRAKKRCLNLLQSRAYTEYKLREKLLEGFYPHDVIEEAIGYVKSFRYLDDYDYAYQYIFYHKESETKRKIEEKLRQKGIDKGILQKVFEDSYCEEEYEELELAQAHRLLQKKHYDSENMDWKEKQRIYSYLVRKGISSSIAQKVMSIMDK